jgi:hypothetical protein
MVFRDHPLMSCYGVRNWPPAWIWLNGPGNNFHEAKSELLQRSHYLRLKPPIGASCTFIMKNHFIWAAYCSMTSLSAAIYHNF